MKRKALQFVTENPRNNQSNDLSVTLYSNYQLFVGYSLGLTWDDCFDCVWAVKGRNWGLCGDFDNFKIMGPAGFIKVTTPWLPLEKFYGYWCKG